MICDGELAPVPAAQPGGPGQGQGRRPDRADPRHLRPARADPRRARRRSSWRSCEYGKQRLRGWGGNLSRQAGGRVGSQGGGIGGRGPGETKLETDRRRISTRMAKLRRELAHMKVARVTKKAERVPPRRCRRWRSPATPTPASRRCSTGSPAPRCWSRTRCSRPWTRPPGARRPRDGRVYTLSDTVGFVRHLPHQLVEAFRSTLEEVAEADLIVHVVDGSQSRPAGPDRGGARGAGRDRRRRRARADRDQQGGPADPMVLARLAAREPRCGRRLRPHRARASRTLLAGASRRELPRPERRGRRAGAVRPWRPGQPDPRARARCCTSSTCRAGSQVRASGEPRPGRRARSSSRPSDAETGLAASRRPVVNHRSEFASYHRPSARRTMATTGGRPGWRRGPSLPAGGPACTACRACPRTPGDGPRPQRPRGRLAGSSPGRSSASKPSHRIVAWVVLLAVIVLRPPRLKSELFCSLLAVEGLRGKRQWRDSLGRWRPRA